MKTRTGTILAAVLLPAVYTSLQAHGDSTQPNLDEMKQQYNEARAAEQLIKETGKPRNTVKVTKVAPAVQAGNIMFPPAAPKLSSSQMEKLINLAQYVHENKPSGIDIGHILNHTFQIQGTNRTDGRYNLTRIDLTRTKTTLEILALDPMGGGIDFEGFYIQPNGTVGLGGGDQWTEKRRELLEKEVSFWVNYETKRGRYPPNPKPDPNFDDDDDGFVTEGGLGKYYRPVR